MTRQVESISDVDTLEDKKPTCKDIAEYFLTSEESTLTQHALQIYQYRNTIDFVSFIGDEFFRYLFSSLLDVWDVKTLNDKKKFDPSARIHSVSLPGVLERRDDLPKIILFFIESYIEKSRHESKEENNMPESFGLLMLGSLLSYPGWKDFNHLRRFIEQSITLCPEKIVTFDQSFKMLKHLFTPSETAPKELDIDKTEWIDISKTDPVYAIGLEFATPGWLSSDFVEWYSRVMSDDEDRTTEFPVHLDRTYHAMKNLIEIDELYPDIRVHSPNRTKEDPKIAKCFGKRWVNFSKDLSIESIEKKVSTALKYKNFESYIRWTEKRNINLLVREPDNVFSMWDRARVALGINQFEHKATDSDGNEEFRFSPDYASVHYRGTGLTFGPKSQQIVEYLHKQHLNKTPEVHEQTILGDLNLAKNQSVTRHLKEFFKESDGSYNPAFGTLIVKGKRRGTFRLNL